MVDIKTETKPQNGKPDNPRHAIREQRLRRLRLIKNGKPTHIRVFAANEALHEVLRHPTNNIRFRGAMEQGVEWPNDSFTQRRIAEGSVLTDGPGSGQPVEDDESLNPRQQFAARYRKPETEAKKQEASDSKNGESSNGKNGSLRKPEQQPQAETPPQAEPQPAT